MTSELITIPCRSDNYAFILRCTQTGAVGVFDAPEAAPILDALEARGWGCDTLFITHHHNDHVDGLAEIAAKTGCEVVGAAADTHRIEGITASVVEGDKVHLGALEGHVLNVSGHTIGHVAYHFPKAKAAFTADSLMALGCGRLFEGTAEQMWTSLSKLAALPDETLICSGHEYTEANLAFAETIEPDSPALATRGAAIRAARAKGAPTVPSLLADERATNPFLRATAPDVKAHLGLPEATDAEAFAEIRARKDRF
ncbi:MAG: hydroxyacylglutathione hydrolase [Pseudomonadota bacterium]